MKKLLFILCLSILLGNAQKYDHQWLIGYTGSLVGVDSLYGINNLDFRSNPFSKSWKFRSISLQEGGSGICDKNGELQFYTNGFEIRNRHDSLLVNGTGLNPGQDGVAFNIPGGSYPTLHGSMILPSPSNDSQYFLFHSGFEYGTQAGAYIKYLYYTLIDMSVNSGKGSAIEKNHVIIQDTLVSSTMNACKHANGRDWWFIIPETLSNCFYVYLLTPDGIDTIGKQCEGDTVHVQTDRGMSCFTPDGSMYIWSNPYEHLNTLEFDRCNGTFGKHKRYQVLDSVQQATGNALIDGVAVSPNSKYLYVATGTEVRQFDLTAANLVQSEVIVANVWTNAPRTTASFCQLAPDGKIYITPSPQDTFLHVVNYPDSQGLACGFVKNQVELPSWNHTYLPNYPHYRLGPLAGSVCDSLPHVDVTEIKNDNSRFNLFPNPAANSATLTFKHIESEDLEIKLYTIQGTLLHSEKLSGSQGNYTINTTHFNSGVVVVRLTDSFKTIYSSRLIVFK
ncbi:MAG: T9SS type A sorting domain-containing protein [Chitinophagales bacterium]